VVHNAAAERLCSKRKISRLPESEEAELRVYIEKDQVSVLLDLSGEPLFKRGYRTSGGIAPLRETTAAAIILHSGWRRKFPLYDPFCGSGTIAIEAALYAWDIAPGLGRYFALDKLLLGNREIERKTRDELLSKVDFSRLVRIGGSDSDAASVTAANASMKRAIDWVIDKVAENAADLPPLPSFEIIPMEEASSTKLLTPGKLMTTGGETGFVMCNPPYGRRLGDTESAEKTYSDMRKLKDHFPGWKLVIITDHPGFESFFGTKADSCREITNGAILSYLYQYEKL
jgi:putative N6-adenine-specific DNA methylase